MRLLAIVSNNRVEALIFSWLVLFALGWTIRAIVGRIKFRKAIKHRLDEYTKASLSEMEARDRRSTKAAKKWAGLAGRQAVAIRGAMDLFLGLDIEPDINDN